MYSESLSLLTDQKANLENVPPAENLAKTSHSSPAFSKPDVILSSVPSQEVAMSKLAWCGRGGINFTCFSLAKGKGLCLAFVGPSS